MTEIDFGYYPSPLAISVGNIEIRTLPNLEATVALVNAEGVVGKWIYAPPQEVRHFGATREIRTMPYPSRVFGLPKTHVLRHFAAESTDHITFLLWAESFFEGIRLTATEAGFIDATPLVPGTLVDFGMSGPNKRKALALADAFWIANRCKPMRAKRFAAAVHSLFLSQNPLLLQFEKFIFLYTALDACFALASSINPRPKHLSHAERVAWMCDLFSMETPVWAIKNGGQAEIAILRNNALHEALFMGEPLGFALHGVGTGSNLTLEMHALICRLLVALLGAPSSGYVRAAINTRQRHLLTL
ncbi:hypothetical protein [Mesorhizobium sp. Z1-4]|uniref:hypothetical protein n=1 Tax=Mesorhizobium sp. Z1-4 TaxID=2448478 RepID=UPI000FD95804|nr:hypothetical protein [Mesorhizobium sp. Z1-4]